MIAAKANVNPGRLRVLVVTTVALAAAGCEHCNPASPLEGNAPAQEVWVSQPGRKEISAICTLYSLRSLRALRSIVFACFASFAVDRRGYRRTVVQLSRNSTPSTRRTTSA